ncbi:MAG: TonB family protein [Candidatus Kapaibacteriota bacterium]
MISLITIVSCIVISTTMFAYANLDQAKKAFSSKDYQKAYSAIQEDIKDSPKNPDVLLLAGDIYNAIGSLDSAIILYKVVEKLQPGNYGIPRKIGQIHAARKDYKSAMTILSSIVKDFPKDPWNHLAFADVALLSGKLPEAEKSFSEAKKLNSRLWQASIGLANIALKKGDQNTALINYEDALKIDPNMLEIRKQHVKLVKDNKDPDPSPDETISVNKPPFAENSMIMSKLQYPELAKKAGLEGKVVLRVLVRRNGSVKKYIVENTDSDLFNKSAGDAVMKTQFLPALQNGKPVACWLSVPISFKLR